MSSDSQYGRKQCSILILGSSEGRFDEIIAAYHNVFQYMTNYTQMQNTEIYMISKSSISVFLRIGTNNITTSKTIENREEGYSVIPLQGAINVLVQELDENNIEVYKTNRELKFGSSVFFKKKSKGDMIKIDISGQNNGLIIYSTTTIFHKK